MKNYQAFIILAFLLLLASLAYWQSEIFTPFIIAFITAYLLQPVSHKLENKFHIQKTSVAILIICFFILFILVGFIVAGPFLYEQLSIFIQKLPTYKNSLENNIIPRLADQIDDFNPAFAQKIKSHIQSATDQLLGETFHIINNIWQYTLTTISFLANLVLITFVLFYFIRDWDQITETISDIIPVAYKERYQVITHEISELLASYIRGQLNACLILALYYSTILAIFKVDFALLLGIISGFLIIIPFIGPALSLLLTLLISYIGGNSLYMHLYIVIFYFIGHMIESYILIPRLVGSSIGLHPVWIVFAILALGHLYGIIGIIIAIPLAGIAKVLLKFAFGYYKNSELYEAKVKKRIKIN